MKKWNLIVDIDRCNNCNNCYLAVKDEHVDNEFAGYAAPQPKHGHHWLEMKRAEHGRAPIIDIVNVPTMCNHCDQAPCVKAGGGAVTKREDGIVIIDPVKAKGRKDLVEACPYGAVWWNEELQLAQHWIFDAHLLDQGWKEPRCAQACPTGAISAVKLEDADMQSMVQQQDLEVLEPQLNTQPRVYYKGLHRYNRWVLGGSVSSIKDGVEDCIEGAAVELRSGEQLVATTSSDTYGEFRFTKLPAQAAEYEVRIVHPGHETLSYSANMQSSLTLENLVLQPSTADA